MNVQQRRTMQEARTAMAPGDVLAAARRFFATKSGVYAAFLEREGPTHIVLRGQGGEEVVLATSESDGATLVTGSTYLFDAQVARFLSTLPPAPAASVA